MNEFPTIFSLTEEEIDINQVVREITLPTTGAAVVFTGMVRAETIRTDRQTDYLEYEAYEPMALDKLKQVAEEIRHKWPTVVGIGSAHRVGEQ